jgi:hypothetical protein
VNLGRTWRLVVPALLLLGLLPSTGAQAATINFDDLTSAPGRDSGTGLLVNTQYDNLGVTFNDPSAFDYSKPTPIPGFAHSGTIAVEPCAGIEFCSSPVRATFTEPQPSVGVWVGFSSPLPAPLGVRLTGFDGSSNVVATDDATLPANSGPTPIQTPLTIDAPPARIVTLEVSVTTGGGYTNGLAVDDVSFSTVGPPPPCTANAAPTVNLLNPPGGTSVHNNEFLLEGSIDNHGAPITNASVIATSETNATRTAYVYPSLIQPQGGNFGPVRFGGLLFSPAPGTHDIVVTATNCKGTGTSDQRRVLWTPLPPTTRFHQIGPIEVTQSVQTPLNSVPLVAGSAGGVKRTFARVYLQVEGGADSVSHVTGTLTATRPDGSPAPGPLRVSSINGPTFIPSASLEDPRSRLIDSLYFELPPEWLGEGRLHLQLEHIEIEDEQTAFPCDGCENSGPTGTLPGGIGPAFVNFHRIPPMRLVVVSMPWLPSGSNTPNIPSQVEIDNVVDFVKRMYPASEIQVSRATMPTQDPPATCHEMLDRISDWAGSQAAQDPRVRYYGLLEDPSGSVTVKLSDGHAIAGCASVPSQFGWGKTGGSIGPFDGAHTAAHELGHMYGRHHTLACDPYGSVEPDYPHPGGLIGDPLLGDAQGLDSGGSFAGPELYDWRDGFTDIMSYCAKRWISDYTYGQILGNICAGDQANCPDHETIVGRALRRGVGPARADRPVARKGKGRLRLSVRGWVARSGRVSLDGLAAARGLALSARPRKSRFAILLRGGRGHKLARYPFDPKPVGEDTAESITEVVPFRARTTRVAIVKGKRTLASKRVSRNAPSIRVGALKKARKHRLRLRWRAHDADGGRLTYTVLYLPRRGRTIPLVSGLRRRSYRIAKTQLAGGRKARIEVIASDGVRTGADSSKRFKVPFKPPRVQISTPAPGAGVLADSPVQLVASVHDPQDVRFAGSKVVWHSSLQGELGHGTAIEASLAPGTHEITATATNSGGKSAVAAVTVSAAPVPPLFIPDLIVP